MTQTIGITGIVGVALAIALGASEVAGQLPTWVTITGFIAMPTVTLIGLVLSHFNSTKKIEDTKKDLGEKLDIQKVEIDGKMDELLRLTRDSAHAAGVLEGLAQATAAAIELQKRVATVEALKAQGAAELLVAQQTPPAFQP